MEPGRAAAATRRRRRPSRRTPQALQLVERYGVVTREAVLAEGVVGGFANVYGVLKVLEERGQVRRGYFVDGLGAAQFAVPGAVDRLRAVRETPDPVIHPDDVPAPIVLAATDPAQPYGAALGVARLAGPAGRDRRMRWWCCGPARRWRGSTARAVTSSRSRPPRPTVLGRRTGVDW